MKYIDEAVKMIEAKEEYTAEEYEQMYAEVLRLTDDRTKAALKELCLSFMQFNEAVNTLDQMNINADQLQFMLNKCKPAECGSQKRLPKNDTIPLLIAGLNGGKVYHYVKKLSQGVEL